MAAQLKKSVKPTKYDHQAFIRGITAELVEYKDSTGLGLLAGKGVSEVIATTSRDYFLSTIIRIHRSLEKLADFDLLIDHLSDDLASAGYSRVAQFSYHVENYLSALYVIHETIKRFLGNAKKVARKQNNPRLHKEVESLKDAFIEQMKPLMSIRGGSVHTKGYSDSDDLLRRLKVLDFNVLALEFLEETESEDLQVLKLKREEMLLRARRGWKATMAGINGRAGINARFAQIWEKLCQVMIDGRIMEMLTTNSRPVSLTTTRAKIGPST